MEVCFAVSMRLVVLDDGVMNRKSDAMTRKRCRKEGGRRPVGVIEAGKRVQKCVVVLGTVAL